MPILYLDCFSGAAGDMLVAALLDLGGSLEELREDLSRLAIPGLRVEAERGSQGALAGTRFRVDVAAAGAQPQRNLAAILALLEESSLPGAVCERAARTFTRLAEAEAQVHGCDVATVHFHEVGALDSITDVVAFFCLLERWGSPRVVCSPVAVGSGFVESSHGSLPVPAPATLGLLAGVPLEMTAIREELVTPTGAALLVTVVEEFGRHFQLVPRRVGYGLGTRRRDSPPNAVRAVLADVPQSSGERVEVLETNLDDATGQELGRLMELCLAAGALDVVVLAAQMKKGRPGHVVQVLARPEHVDALEQLLLRESPTLGVRSHGCRRSVRRRESTTRATSLGDVRVKLVWDEDDRPRPRVEFDELSRLAREHDRPLAEIRRRLEAELE